MGAFSDIRRTFKSNVLGGAREARKVGQWVGQNVNTQNVLIGINTATALINTPVGQAALYSLGALGGPAGLAVANVISGVSRGLLIGSALALGGGSLKEGLSDLARSKNIGEGLQAMGQVGYGLVELGLGGYRAGADIVRGSLNPLHAERVARWGKKGVNFSKEIASSDTVKQFKNLVGWDKPGRLGGGRIYDRMTMLPSEKMEILRPLGKPIKITKFKPITKTYIREPVARPPELGVSKSQFLTQTVTSEPIKKASRFNFKRPSVNLQRYKPIKKEFDYSQYKQDFETYVQSKPKKFDLN